MNLKRARVYKNYYTITTLYYNKLSSKVDNYLFRYKDISLNKYTSLKIIDDIDFSSNLYKSSSIIKKYSLYIEDENSVSIEIINLKF